VNKYFKYHKCSLIYWEIILFFVLLWITVSFAQRGYLTTPQELSTIKSKADQNIEPYKSAVSQILTWADKTWDYQLDPYPVCTGADDPLWVDNGGGAPIVYSKALVYHLTNDENYAAQVKDILESVMTNVLSISTSTRQCELNFAWGIQEYVFAGDLIEDYWSTLICEGPVSFVYGDNQMCTGNCKTLWQNWLVKNPYYIVSRHGPGSINNWSTAGAVTCMGIADYCHDRSDILLEHRNYSWSNNGLSWYFTPAEAYSHMKQYALDSMNGYTEHYGSNRSCDYFENDQCAPGPMVKGQITENGIVPLDARRAECCNIIKYNGTYQNYPQINLANLAGFAEILWRRGDASIYDNIDNTDIPDYSWKDPDGHTHTTHLYPGRGSLERGVNAIINAGTEWRKDAGLEVLYRYYSQYSKLAETNLSTWFSEIGRPVKASQDLCFTTLTHGFAPGETPADPPVCSPPSLCSSKYNLTITGTPGNTGSVLPQNDSYCPGKMLMAARANSGYVFSHWDGDLSSSQNPVVMTFDSDKNIIAVFEEDLRKSLTVNIIGNGQVKQNPEGQLFDPGTVVTLTAEPDMNEEFRGWTGDAAGKDNPLFVTMDSNKTVTALFSTNFTWSNLDIGSVSAAGRYTEVDNIYTVQGSGADIWGSSDEFHFVYQTFSGPVTISACLVDFIIGVDWAKAGVMIRESLDPDSRNVLMAFGKGRGGCMTLQSRLEKGGISTANISEEGSATTPIWMKLEREDTTITGYGSINGLDWIEAGQTTIDMAADVYVGLAVTSHFDGIMAKAVFQNVTISDFPVSIDSQKDMVPLSCILKQNYPNPFNPSTMIRYYLPRKNRVYLAVYDMRGRLVDILEQGEKKTGEYSYYWEALDSNGKQLPSGIYFYHLKADFYTKTMKMILMH
jgi:hypothetical protein